MADKRISQLVDRGTVANNDVVPIVVSGASTTNKATISSIQTFMQGNLDLGVTSVGITIGSAGTNVNVTGSPITSSGNITINIPTASAANRGLLNSADWNTFNSKLDSVGLIMPSAFIVTNSPLTSNGSISVAGAGTVSQYIRGDGSLADFPEGGGGGSSVNYYLNGSVSQGTIGGVAYREMNKTPILGAGTDITIAADGYIASFITDAGDPALLEIPAGNWNFESYFSASSGGGSPSFYIELYKVNSGGTATLIASNSATPELISFGTSISPYFSPLAVPTTVLTVTDRLAVRYYVTHSGRTITLHTENSHLCQIITTFTTGLTALNGLTAQVQNFATGTSGTDFAISSSVSTHTFNLPDASASARGVVTTGTQTFAGIKNFSSTIVVNQDLQLAATGTASTTFIKNINGAGLTSIGSNGFGFNNSDNIYFSGSNKAGGVFAFNNTGNRTYTLQDASGTLAFTSDIPSLAGYVTLATTQTITGAKTFDTTTSNFLILNSTNASGGALTFRRNGTNVGHIGNSGVLGVGILDDLEVRSGISRALHLKTDGGKLTLSAGGSVTLDGALNGTSASFTGANYLFTLNGGGSTRIAGTIANTSGGMDFGLEGAAGNQLFTGVGSYEGGIGTNNAKAFHIATNGTSRLSIASTGAATFSSSVTAKSLKIENTGVPGFIYFNNTSAPASNYIALGSGANELYFHVNGTDRMVITDSGKVGIGTASPSTRLQINDSGAGAYTILRIHNRQARGAGVGARILLQPNNDFGDTDTGAAISAVNVDGGTQNNTSLIFETSSFGTGVERMRITHGGQVQVGGINRTLVDFDGGTTARFYGGSLTNTFGLGAGSTIYYQGDASQFYPTADNARSLGVSTNRYTAVWAVNGTIQTSDEREKKEIIDSDLGLDFVTKLRPVSFKWKVGQNMVTSEVLKDEEGNPILDEEGKEKTESVITPREGIRTHYGLIAQEVEELLDGKDFGGFIHDEETDIKGLRYDQFVPLLIKAIQELKTEIDSLKNQIK